MVDYNSPTTSVSLVVAARALERLTAANTNRLYGQANPVFTGTLTGVTDGTPLSSNQSNVTANVLGSFAYNPTNGVVSNASTNTLSVIFTPTDTLDYTSATGTLSLVVRPAPPRPKGTNAGGGFSFA